VAAPGSGAALAISQNFSDLLIADLANGATCAFQVFIAAAPVGLRGMFSSDSSLLLAVA
jgi:Na+/serine symporter